MDLKIGCLYSTLMHLGSLYVFIQLNTAFLSSLEISLHLPQPIVYFRLFGVLPIFGIQTSILECRGNRNFMKYLSYILRSFILCSTNCTKRCRHVISGFHRALLQSIVFISRLHALDYTKFRG